MAKRILFLCSQNKLRSPAAETIFAGSLAHKQIAVLNIPDDYEFMDPVLIALLRSKCQRYGL